MDARPPDPQAISLRLSVPGAKSPVGPAQPATQYRTAYCARNEMMASSDDMLARICEYAFARWGDNFTLIITSDNGDQIGEQDIRGNGGVKTAVWEGSARSPLYMFGSAFTPGFVDTVPTVHADLYMTLLDLHGLTDHHGHTKRDGYSILRILDPADPVRLHGRALPIWGQYGKQLGNGYIDSATSFKRLRGVQSCDFKPMVDYELLAYSRTPAQEAAFQARANAIQIARWNVLTNANPSRTI